MRQDVENVGHYWLRPQSWVHRHNDPKTNLLYRHGRRFSHLSGRPIATLKRAQATGDLPADCDPDQLAGFILVVGWGMALAAQSGATRDDLHRTVATALKAWPS